MDDGRYAVVTADERDGHEGQYRLGFSETAEFDGDRMKIMEGVSLESLKKDLTGIANGSIVVGENRLEYAKTQENAPASGESVVNGQVMAESASETKPKKRTAAQIARENAEKQIAAEKARLEREGSETLKKNSRQIARIDKNLDYLKNAVLHRRNTDGGNASSIIFEDPALRAMVKRLASRGTAYGLMHKSDGCDKKSPPKRDELFQSSLFCC